MPSKTSNQLKKPSMWSAVDKCRSRHLYEGMLELKEMVTDTARIIREVNSWGEQVSSILDIVDKITEQTALLSLNASIVRKHCSRLSTYSNSHDNRGNVLTTFDSRLSNGFVQTHIVQL